MLERTNRVVLATAGVEISSLGQWYVRIDRFDHCDAQAIE